MVTIRQVCKYYFLHFLDKTELLPFILENDPEWQIFRHLTEQRIPHFDTFTFDNDFLIDQSVTSNSQPYKITNLMFDNIINTK